ncbi:MAG: UbiA family prenyltransferase [Polyangia bacterium]|jgi:4-hydroxybenzoate polyprenyltransferase|nr:UbiA family prenyltransferase [Polyangia bacterium]
MGDPRHTTALLDPAKPPEASSPPERASLAANLSTAASIGRLHIVAIAAMGCLTFGWIFTGRYYFGIAAICGLDWFIVNLLNRAVDLPEDRANAIRGTNFVARHRQAVLWVGFGALGLSLALVALWEPALTPFRIGGHLLGLSYNWPIFPGGRRLKELYFFKNTASATGFMITVFGYPLSVAALGKSSPGLAPDITLATVLISGLFFFLFELSYEVIYDLRDAPGDAAAGVRSYPVAHGERGAVRIIDALLASSVLVLLGGYLASLVPWRLAILFAAPVIQLFLYKRLLRKGITSAHCIGITWLGVALLATYHLWELLGLPGSQGG